MLGGPKFIYRVDAQDKICLNVENDTYYDKLCTKITFLGRSGNATIKNALALQILLVKESKHFLCHSQHRVRIGVKMMTS